MCENEQFESKMIQCRLLGSTTLQKSYELFFLGLSLSKKIIKLLVRAYLGTYFFKYLHLFDEN